MKVTSVFFSFSFAFFLLSIACNQDRPIIMTVTGSIQASQIGTTLSHEHVLVDFIGADSTGYHRWDRQKVVEKVLPFLNEAKELGVRTLIECTPAYLGRDPILLKMLSQKSGMQILTNTGYYGAIQNRFIPQHAFNETVDQLVERWVKEWEQGIEDTGIRPGFIKIAVDRDDTLSLIHQKLVRAAARTHLKTGLTIASHTGPEKPAFTQLSLLEEEGVAPDAFIWVHAQNGDKAAHIKAAQRGAWISLDNVNSDSTKIKRYAEFILNMKNNGLLQRVLISHDAGWYRVGEPDGGKFRGYTAIFRELIPALKNNGFTDDEIDQLLVSNPQTAFRIKVRKIDSATRK